MVQHLLFSLLFTYRFFFIIISVSVQCGHFGETSYSNWRCSKQLWLRRDEVKSFLKSNSFNGFEVIVKVVKMCKIIENVLTQSCYALQRIEIPNERLTLVVGSITMMKVVQIVRKRSWILIRVIRNPRVTFLLGRFRVIKDAILLAFFGLTCTFAYQAVEKERFTEQYILTTFVVLQVNHTSFYILNIPPPLPFHPFIPFFYLLFQHRPKSIAPESSSPVKQELTAMASSVICFLLNLSFSSFRLFLFLYKYHDCCLFRSSTNAM